MQQIVLYIDLDGFSRTKFFENLQAGFDYFWSNAVTRQYQQFKRVIHQLNLPGIDKVETSLLLKLTCVN